MPPTQAQIEAARNKIALMRDKDVSAKDIAVAALTAAAEVDDTEWTCADCGHKQKGHRFKCEKCGFYIGRVDTAAAEVGEKFTAEAYHALPKYDPETIERCAQVAQSFRTRFFNHTVEMSDAIAAAIRALKDKP